METEGWSVWGDVVHQWKLEAAATEFFGSGSLVKMQAVMHCHIRHTSVPPGRDIELEMTLELPF